MKFTPVIALFLGLTSAVPLEQAVEESTTADHVAEERPMGYTDEIAQTDAAPMLNDGDLLFDLDQHLRQIYQSNVIYFDVVQGQTIQTRYYKNPSVAPMFRFELKEHNCGDNLVSTYVRYPGPEHMQDILGGDQFFTFTAPPYSGTQRTCRFVLTKENTYDITIDFREVENAEVPLEQVSEEPVEDAAERDEEEELVMLDPATLDDASEEMQEEEVAAEEPVEEEAEPEQTHEEVAEEPAEEETEAEAEVPAEDVAEETVEEESTGEVQQQFVTWSPSIFDKIYGVYEVQEEEPQAEDAAAGDEQESEEGGN